MRSKTDGGLVVTNGSGRGPSGAMLGLLRSGTPRGVSDGQLLERFATGPPEAAEWAFAALVDRHGAMVLRVCRGVLADPCDAQDAFQATFLVLIRKARGLWVAESLGPWLHQVALRTARCAREDAARRHRLERKIGEARPESRPEDRESERILHEELGRLPDRFRAPLVLCDLEGRTHEEAARHLGWPIGTVKSRQSRGRERLRDRLVRRGLGPSAATALAPSRIAVPPALAQATTELMARFASSGGLVAGQAPLLAHLTLRTLTMTQWWKLAAILAALSASVAGGIATNPTEAPDAPARNQEAGKAPVDVPVVAVEAGKRTRSLFERGNLESSRVSDGICEIEGKTTILGIRPEGLFVRKGDLVCELDSGNLRDALVNQGVARSRAEEDVELARIARSVAEGAVREHQETSKLESQALQATIDQAEAALPRATAGLERARDVRSQIERAIGAKGAAATPADLVARLDVEEKIDASEATIARETAALALAKGRKDVLERINRPRIAGELQAEAKRKARAENVAIANLGLEKSRENKLRKHIESCKLFADIDGVVVYADEQNPRRPDGIIIAEGETVRERQVIYRITDLTRMRLAAKFHESFIDVIKLGQPAKVEVDAFPGQSVVGKITSIAPRPDPLSIPGGEKLYTVLIDLEEGPEGLRPGMTAAAEVMILTGGGPVVPLTAVIEGPGDGRRVVMKRPDGAYELRDVALWPDLLGDRFQVARGLRVGEVVVADPRKDLGDELKRMFQENPWPAPKSSRP